MSAVAQPAGLPAPPAGVSVSEQALESPAWRVQLDLGTGGVRSLRWRGPSACELADPEAEPQLFQAFVRREGGAPLLSRFIRSRARFNSEGAVLAVEAELGGGVWRTEFGVEARQGGLRVRAGWSGPPPGLAAELSLAFPFAVAAGERWAAAGGGAMGVRAGGRGLIATATGAAWHAECGTVSPIGPEPLVLELRSAIRY
jgi:hypothetical protein